MRSQLFNLEARFGHGSFIVPRLWRNHRARQSERCGVSKDFEVQALEQIKTGTTSEVEDGLQLLKHATETCASFGDAWYYRSLFERKLGQAPRRITRSIRPNCLVRKPWTTA